MDMLERVLRILAWIVAIIAGITTTAKNITDLIKPTKKKSKKKKKPSPRRKRKRR